MRIARINTPSGPRYAEHDSTRGWLILEGSIGTGFTRTGNEADPDSQLLAPCEPRVVMGMAHNGLPDGHKLPAQAFLKSARTVIGPDQPIMLDPNIGETHVETELAIVIARTARNLTHDNALDVVFGYTIGNDVTSVDQTVGDELLTQAKQGDGYTPIGPWIETDLSNVDNLGTRVFVDDVLIAHGSTSGLANLVRDQLVYVTRYLTLDAGDVLLGGCPATFASVRAGQQVRLEIDGLGALKNPVHSSRQPNFPAPHDGAHPLKEDSHAV